ncbi:ABC transporter substrate-binding protein [Deinococcus oregonensis]|uniref:ABC transporter substrate-binding protein n=1 Tax=Deinococcus oregonensis TaxID=1805970 RepID=A0ABV6B4Y4_9DEIO
MKGKIRNARLVGITALSLMGGAAQAQTPAKGNVIVWMHADNAKYFKTVADNFMKANPEAKVTIREYPNEAYKTAIQVGVASNQPPDVFFNWAGDDSFKFARSNQVLDLTPYAQSAGWGKTLGKGALNAFSQDGKLWGAPFSQESKFFFYNKALLAKQGLKVPTSFSQLIGSCKTLKAKGITPISFGNSERWPGVHYLTILNQKVVGEKQTGLDYRLQASADKLFTDAGYVRAFQMLKDMQDAGCFNNAVNSVSPQIAEATFYSGQAAMNFCGTWCINTMNTNGFKDKYGIFPFPRVEGGKGDQNYVIAGPIGLQISAKSQNKPAAAAFVAFAVSRSSQIALLADEKRIPVDAAAATTVKVEPIQAEAIADLGKASGTALWLDTVLDNTIAEAYLNGIQEVLNGTKTPQQVVGVIRQAAINAKQKLGR